jgi:26S proteasome regulatory subunit N2
LKVKKAAPAPTTGGAGPSGDDAPEGVTAVPSTGPVDYNFIDEGDSEAGAPGEFDYLSDGGGDDDE